MKADDLFSGEGAIATPDPTPPIARLLWLAVPLNLAGPCLFTGVPGAALSLWAWYRADEELAKVETGALPESFRRPLTNLRNTAFGNLSLCMMLLILQIVLFSMGVYQSLLSTLVGGI